jgi:ABC-2 type transport system ATP-binding protein
VIQAEGLIKYYGERCAVRGVDFEVPSGQVVGFLGLNGAGKTTILRMLAGDLEPSAGRILVDGRDLQEDPKEYRRRVGFLPEGAPGYADMSVSEHLSYLCRLRGIPSRSVAARVAEACERLDIGRYKDEPLGNLSHGYRQRVGIASTIVHGPELVILDEPITGLDPVQIVEMRSLVRGLAGEHTVLVSSHILTEISQTCHHILVLREGEIALRGSEEELRRRTTSVHSISLSVRGEGEAAEALAASIDGVREAALVYEGDGRADLTVSANRDVREELAGRLVSEGFGLLRLVRTESELEAVFLDLARGGGGGEGLGGAP